MWGRGGVVFKTPSTSLWLSAFFFFPPIKKKEKNKSEWMNECLAVFPQEFKLQSYVIIARANSSVIQPADPGSRF